MNIFKKIGVKYAQNFDEAALKKINNDIKESQWLHNHPTITGICVSLVGAAAAVTASAVVWNNVFSGKVCRVAKEITPVEPLTDQEYDEFATQLKSYVKKYIYGGIFTNDEIYAASIAGWIIDPELAKTHHNDHNTEYDAEIKFRKLIDGRKQENKSRWEWAIESWIIVNLKKDRINPLILRHLV